MQFVHKDQDFMPGVACGSPVAENVLQPSAPSNNLKICKEADFVHLEGVEAFKTLLALLDGSGNISFAQR